MLLIVSLILTTAYLVSEKNDANERLSWVAPKNPPTPAVRFQIINVISYAIIALTGIVMLILLPTHNLDLLDWVILLMFAWSGLSILWSTNRRLTFRWLGGWLATGCAVFAVGLTCTMDETLFIIAVGCHLYFLVGIFDEFYTGRFILTSSYRFHGFVGCNRQSAAAILMLFIGIYFYQSEMISTAVLIAITCYTLAIAGLARSRTSTWAALAGAAVWALLSLPSSRAVAIALGGAFAGLCLIGFIPSVQRKASWLLMLGRKKKNYKELSGRTTIWANIWPVILAHSLLGNGYGAIWTDERHYELSRLNNFCTRIQHAHSIYLDSLLNGGVIALLILLSVMGIAASTAYQMSPSAGPFMQGLITFALIHGMGESTLVLPLHRAFAFFALLVSLKPV